jgi:hypothetical protein
MYVFQVWTRCLIPCATFCGAGVQGFCRGVPDSGWIHSIFNQIRVELALAQLHYLYRYIIFSLSGRAEI